MAGSKKVPNEKLKKDLIEAATDQEIMAKSFNEVGQKKLEGSSDWSVQAKFNGNANKSIKLNDTILSLAKKAKSGVQEDDEEENPQQNTASQLGVISMKVKKVAQELQVDDTPKGKMFACTKEIGQLMEILVFIIFLFIFFLFFILFLLYFILFYFFRVKLLNLVTRVK